MNVEDFTFELPEELIAAHPAARREDSRLLHLPAGGTPIHRRFREIGQILRRGDLLVVNNSRVIPARLYGTRSSGGAAEFLLLRCENREGAGDRWRALARPAKKLRGGDEIRIAQGFHIRIVGVCEGGERELLLIGDAPVAALLARHGHLPLPPYILKRRADEQGPDSRAEDLYRPEDKERYQTVYAAPEGSVAAPTAGLHFTRELMDQLEREGITFAPVTLHVGAGTFQGMTEGGRVEEHVMHEEFYEVPAETSAAIRSARDRGGRVIAVGTTSLRTLESAWDDEARTARTGSGSTRIMIAPGYRVRSIDALITNFHLPRSTLMLLVSALAGRERILNAYAEAIRERYRFFSYGDAMFVEVERPG